MLINVPFFNGQLMTINGDIMMYVARIEINGLIIWRIICSMEINV